MNEDVHRTYSHYQSDPISFNHHSKNDQSFFCHNFGVHKSIASQTTGSNQTKKNSKTTTPIGAITHAWIK